MQLSIISCIISLAPGLIMAKQSKPTSIVSSLNSVDQGICPSSNPIHGADGTPAAEMTSHTRPFHAVFPSSLPIRPTTIHSFKLFANQEESVEMCYCSCAFPKTEVTVTTSVMQTATLCPTEAAALPTSPQMATSVPATPSATPAPFPAYPQPYINNNSTTSASITNHMPMPLSSTNLAGLPMATPTSTNHTGPMIANGAASNISKASVVTLMLGAIGERGRQHSCYFY